MPEIPKEVIEKVRRLEISAKERVLDLFSGMYHSAFKGQGIEIEDIREYQPGDDIKSISWTKTAQMGRPFVKTFHEERDLIVFLLVDISSSQDFASKGIFKRELVAELGALLAFSAIFNHDRVGLILFSSEIEKYIPPKRGTRHGVRLIRELLTFKPKNRGTDIAKALKFLQTVHHKKAICFLLSDFLTDTPYEHDFLMTSKKDDLIAIRIFDPLEENLPPLGLIQLEDLETGKRGLYNIDQKVQKEFQENVKKRISKLTKLAKEVSASLIEMSTQDAPYDALHRFFKLRKKARPW